MRTQTIEVASEVEEERLQRIQEQTAEEGPEWTAQFKPGSFGCHELLDRTAMLARMVEEAVLDHPACLLEAEWYALAERAVSALNELYQRVGSVQLEDDR